MATKVFVGNGFNPQAAVDNSNALCDQWIAQQAAAGKPVHEDARTTSPVAKEDPTAVVWVAQTTLTYHH